MAKPQIIRVALRCFVLVENSSLIGKWPNQREIIDSECDFPHNCFQIWYILYHI